VLAVIARQSSFGSKAAISVAGGQVSHDQPHREP
jgi:hypothetical protein